MKKLFSLFAVLFVLLSSVGSSAYAVSTALTPKYETLAQNFIAKVSAAKSKYTNDTDYYNFLVALEDQLVAYRTKNYSKVVARNLATRLIDDVGAIRSTYEDDGTALALDGLLGGTIVPTSQLTPAPTSANTVVASTSVTSTSPASNGNAGVVRSPIIIPTAAPAAQVPTERFPGIDGVLGTSDDCDAIKVDGITWAACDLGDGRWYQWGRNVWFAPGVTAGSSNTYNLGYATYSGTGDGFRYSFVNIDNNDNLAAAMNSKKIFVISGGDAAQYGGGGWYRRIQDCGGIQQYVNEGGTFTRNPYYDECLTINPPGNSGILKKYSAYLSENPQDGWYGAKKQAACPAGWNLPSANDVRTLQEGVVRKERNNSYDTVKPLSTAVVKAGIFPSTYSYEFNYMTGDSRDPLALMKIRCVKN